MQRFLGRTKVPAVTTVVVVVIVANYGERKPKRSKRSLLPSPRARPSRVKWKVRTLQTDRR